MCFVASIFSAELLTSPLLIVEHQMALNEHWGAWQADAKLAVVLPSVLLFPRNGGINHFSATQVQAVNKRAEHTDQKQQTFTGTTLVEMAQSGNGPGQESRDPRLPQIDFD